MEGHSSIVLVGFSTDPFGRLVREHLESLGIEVFELDKVEADPAATEVTPRSWSAVAWENRKGGYEKHLYSLSEEIITPPHLAALLQCFDRVFLEPMSVADVLGYTGSLVHSASDALRYLPPDAPILFLSSPHFPDDITLALVAQSHGRSVFTLRTTAVNRHVWLVKLFGLEPCSLYLPETVESFRSQIGLEKSERINASKLQNRRLGQSQKSLVRETLSLAPHRLARIMLPDLLNRRIKVKPLRRDSNHYWGFLGRWGMTRVRLKHSFRRARVRSFLAAMETRELPERFIYVPLHFQPERSTLPEAGIYRNQAVLVAELEAFSAANPELRLEVVVKEHPRQNSGDIRQFNFRETEFYSTLAKNPHVRIVSQHLESEELISKACVVVSANGSSAWEALLAGVPSLTGAFTWHSTCSASPFAGCPEAIRQKLPELLRLSREDVHNALGVFLDSTSFLIPGTISSKHLPDVAESRVLARQMSASITRAVLGADARWIPIDSEIGLTLGEGDDATT